MSRLSDGIRRLLGGGEAPALPARSGPSSQYMRGEQSPIFFAWNPVLRDGREDVRAAYWRAAARVIDSIQNSGWLAGAVEQAVSAMVGNGLRLAAKPDAEALGWTADKANTWARIVERRFEAWAESPLECDAAGKATLALQAEAAVRSYFAYGEVLGLVPWIRRPVSVTRTKLQLLPPHRLTQDGNGTDLFQGVRVDRDGLPISYRLRLADPFLQTGDVIEIGARDGAGRPRVLHFFSGDVGQMRGISPLAPALRVVRQFDQLADATLSTALIQAIFAATVQSAAPTGDALQALLGDDEQGSTTAPGLGDLMGARSEWYERSKLDLGGASRAVHLFPGETLDFKRSETPNGNYESFAKFLLREIASCLGLSFETVTGDYSGATYSSVRMSTSEKWPIVLRRRKHIPGRLYQAAYECWLEEEIDAGRIPFPNGLDGFLANRAAVCRADWRGPARPQADDLKTAKAHETLDAMGATTLEMICADYGLDWEDVLEQRAREMALRKKLGLPDPQTVEKTMADKIATQPGA